MEEIDGTPGPTPRRDARRLALLALGWLLIVASPIVGIVPGPGGVFLLAGGLALLLRHSRWAKRRYVRLRRRWPRVGRIADRALRRPGAVRRALRDADTPAAD